MILFNKTTGNITVYSLKKNDDTHIPNQQLCTNIAFFYDFLSQKKSLSQGRLNLELGRELGYIG